MKRRATTTLLVLPVLLACSAARASDWVSLGKTTDGKQEGFVDVLSIRAVGNIRRAWFKTIFVPHTMNSAGTSKKSLDYTLGREAFDCAEETHRNEAGTVYYEDGTVTSIPATNYPEPWAPVPPETVWDSEMKFLCAWKPTTQTGDPPSQNGDPHLSDVDRSTPAQGVMTIQLPNCGKDYYPSQASRLGEHGAVVVRVCIGIDNKIDGPVELVTSSGFPLLDEAAGKCVAAGRYRAGIVNGAPARTCKDYKVAFLRD